MPDDVDSREDREEDILESEISRSSKAYPKTKKKVIPNNNMDTWLKYIIMNLGQMDDITWVQNLAETIEKNTNAYNAGKFRGDIFYAAFIQREDEKMKKSLGRVVTNSGKREMSDGNIRMTMNKDAASELGQNVAERLIER